MAEHEVLPVLPIRGAVVFPGRAVAIPVSRSVSLRAVDEARKGAGKLFVVTQREPEEEVTADMLLSFGVIGRIDEVQLSLGALSIVLFGEQRGTVIDYRAGDPLHAVVLPVEEVSPLDPNDPAYEALSREVRQRAMEFGRLRGVGEEVLRLLESTKEPGRFADLVAHHLEVEASDKQELLETVGVEARLRRILVLLQRELEKLKAREAIKEHVQKEVGGRQRELFLREQLTAIRRELGEEDATREVEELRQRLLQLELPQAALSEAKRELLRLERARPESQEAQAVRTYLQWLSELPWNVRSEDTLDLKEAARVLDEDLHSLGDVKDRVLEHLAVRLLNARKLRQGDGGHNLARAVARGPILLFVGPPGVGKTALARSVARALGRKYVRIALGGLRDLADIRGQQRHFVGATPGHIIQALKQAGTKNPVILLDEVDDLGISPQGDPGRALLGALDPLQNESFTDHYLGVPFDLSEVLFIASANFVYTLSAPLFDVIEAIEFSGYTEREKAEIAKRYLWPRKLGEAGVDDASFALSDEALGILISEYTREGGVRQLERQLGAVLRKLARRRATGLEAPEAIDAAHVREFLGRARVRPERASAEDEVGVATGMYFTPSGGDIMFVEVAVRRRKKSRGGEDDIQLILTGQLGDVMRESARAALTYITNNARELGIREGAMEVHVHAPAGAIPKDGPSAGVTIATALASALSGRAVRKEIAMSGEITLRGRVLPIGGVKQKVLGAERAGILEIILPEANQRDLEDVPAETRRNLRIHFVRSLKEVLSIALAPEPLEVSEEPSIRPSELHS